MKYLLPLFLLFSCVKMNPHPLFENAKATKEYLVKGKHEFKVKEKVRTKAMERAGYAGFDVVSLTDDQAKALRGKVEWIEENQTVKLSEIWNLEKIGAPVAWASGNKGSANVHVGIIDEGIQYFHQDLCDRVWVNPFDPVDGVDNDGNGYIDDKNGWDFMHNDNTIFDQLDNHGTHVSGTISGKTTGVSNATLISAKFLEGSGQLAHAIKAIDYITDLKIRHNINIPAMNNSWGGVGYSQALADAIQRAANADILFIVASGNNNTNLDVNPIYPASFELPNVITVGANDQNDQRAFFSNYGSGVDVMAPGVSVLSTVLGTETNVSGYGSYSGTSMAAPHVTGAVVLYKSLYPSASSQEIKSKLTGNVNVSSFQGVVNPNLLTRTCQAVPIDLTKPTPPGNVRVASSTSTSATITWDAPYDASGVAYLRLHVRGEMADGTTGHIYNFWGWYTSWNVPGLVSGKTYRVRMVADDKYLNQSDSSNVAWVPIGSVVQPPADTRSISLSGFSSGRQHTLNWKVNGTTPNSIQVRNNTGVIATLAGTVTNFTTMSLKKGGNVSYSVTGIWSDKSIISNTINLRAK
jgi:subtilisin family serine protease